MENMLKQLKDIVIEDLVEFYSCNGGFDISDDDAYGQATISMPVNRIGGFFLDMLAKLNWNEIEIEINKLINHK